MDPTTGSCTGDPVSGDVTCAVTWGGGDGSGAVGTKHPEERRSRMMQKGVRIRQGRPLRRMEFGGMVPLQVESLGRSDKHF
jgi:hypothetical protein